MMKRLISNSDFIRYCEMLCEDRDALNKNLLDEKFQMKDDRQRTRLIARISQIDFDLNKPKSAVWMMENLTEVREAIKDRTRVRQAHGNKTGG